jgi:hypothetical protein
MLQKFTFAVVTILMSVTYSFSQTGLGIVKGSVKDETSSPNIVQVAVGSKDHSTLVAAVKAADLVDALSYAVPFSVFAPTNSACFKKSVVILLLIGEAKICTLSTITIGTTNKIIK